MFNVKLHLHWFVFTDKTEKKPYIKLNIPAERYALSLRRRHYL